MAGINPNVLVNAIAAAATSALTNANNSPSIAADIAPRAQEAIAQDIIERIEDNPTIKHITSTEEWYQSRSNWSAIISLVAPVLAIAGYNLSPEYQTALALMISAAGSMIAAYLARRARTATKPLGA